MYFDWGEKHYIKGVYGVQKFPDAYCLLLLSFYADRHISATGWILQGLPP